jgi:precorrin-6B methylase 2
MRRVVDRIAYRRRGFPTLAADFVWLEDIGLAAPDRRSYQSSPRNMLKLILPESEVGPDDVFLDLGSGVGTVVYEAAQYPFKRVIGVELASQLTRVGQEVMDSQRHRLRCQDIDLVTADATEYEIPGDVSVVYMADPFRGPTFERVIERLVESVNRNPRTVRLIYVIAHEKGKLESMERIRFIRDWRRGYRIWQPPDFSKLYAIDPPPG